MKEDQFISSEFGSLDGEINMLNCAVTTVFFEKIRFFALHRLVGYGRLLSQRGVDVTKVNCADAFLA